MNYSLAVGYECVDEIRRLCNAPLLHYVTTVTVLSEQLKPAAGDTYVYEAPKHLCQLKIASSATRWMMKVVPPKNAFDTIISQ